MRRPALTHLGLVNALGSEQTTIEEGLFAGRTDRMTEHALRTTGSQVPTGRVHEPLPDLPEALAVFDCRNHRLAYAAYLQIAEAVEDLKHKYGPDRIAVVLGSSTAGLDATEAAYEIWKKTGSLPARYSYKKQHAMGSVAAAVAAMAGLRGPSYTLSTACTSSSKAMISARDLLATGFCDAAITGGVDTLCHMTLNGFEALGALARQISQPLSKNRAGLNIGEGAAFFVMTREPGEITLCGSGESSDAHHMSSPHPEGRGAEDCMRAALADAGLEPHQIAYLNLHGTATRQNDAMEAKAVARIFEGVLTSSTKPLVGHCLGAAGSTEAAFCWMALKAKKGTVYPLPPHHWDGQQDPELPTLNTVAIGQQLEADGPTYFMSSSYAFGGNNCTVILGHEPAGEP